MAPGKSRECTGIALGNKFLYLVIARSYVHLLGANLPFHRYRNMAPEASRECTARPWARTAPYFIVLTLAELHTDTFVMKGNKEQEHAAPDPDTVTFLMKAIKKLKHSEPDTGRPPHTHFLNEGYRDTEAIRA